MKDREGKLLDHDRVLFPRVVARLEGTDPQGNQHGHLALRNGHVVMLRTDHPYRLVLNDGTIEEIDLLDAGPGHCTGEVLLWFRIPSPSPQTRR